MSAPLSRKDTIDRVVEKFVAWLGGGQLSDRDVSFDLTPEATRWLGQKGYDDHFEARSCSRSHVIQDHIKKPLADEDTCLDGSRAEAPGVVLL